MDTHIIFQLIHVLFIRSMGGSDFLSVFHNPFLTRPCSTAPTRLPSLGSMALIKLPLLLMQHFTIFGYARSKMTDAELRNMVSKTLTCRIDKRCDLRWSVTYTYICNYSHFAFTPFCFASCFIQRVIDNCD